MTATTEIATIEPAEHPSTREILRRVETTLGVSMGRIGVVFDAMDWAENEITRAQRQHPAYADLLWHAFKILTIPEGVDTEHVYRAHARELLARVVAGQDTRPGTDVEIIMACRAASLVAPMHGPGFGLYYRLFTRAFPKSDAFDIGPADLEHYEAIHGSAIDDAERIMRHKLTDADRVMPKECQGKHHGQWVTCRLAASTMPDAISAADAIGVVDSTCTPVRPLDLGDGLAVELQGVDEHEQPMVLRGFVHGDPALAGYPVGATGTVLINLANASRTVIRPIWVSEETRVVVIDDDEVGADDPAPETVPWWPLAPGAVMPAKRADDGPAGDADVQLELWTGLASAVTKM